MSWLAKVSAVIGLAAIVSLVLWFSSVTDIDEQPVLDSTNAWRTIGSIKDSEGLNTSCHSHSYKECPVRDPTRCLGYCLVHADFSDNIDDAQWTGNPQFSDFFSWKTSRRKRISWPMSLRARENTRRI